MALLTSVVSHPLLGVADKRGHDGFAAHQRLRRRHGKRQSLHLGNRYHETQHCPLHDPGSGGQRFAFEWHGTQPPAGRHWRYSLEKLEKMLAEGRMEFLKNGRPVGRRYLDERSNKPSRHSSGMDHKRPGNLPTERSLASDAAEPQVAEYGQPG